MLRSDDFLSHYNAGQISGNNRLSDFGISPYSVQREPACDHFFLLLLFEIKYVTVTWGSY